MSLSAPARPVLRYHGGKWRMGPWIIGHFPEHKVYVEPFGGAASILLQKPKSRTEIYNDADGEVYGLFKVLRDPASSQRLADIIFGTPFSRDEYKAAYEPSDCPIEQARRTIVKSFMGMGSKGIWVRSGFDARVNEDGFISRKDAFNDMPAILVHAACRLREVVLENTDGIALCERYANHKSTLIYVDPPYVFDSYSGDHIYRHRMTDDDHRRLAAVLNTVKGSVIVSGYHSELYDELFSDWGRVESPSMADGGRKRTEVLWLRNVRIKSPELALGGIE